MTKTNAERVEAHYARLVAGNGSPYRKKLKEECKQIAAWIPRTLAERFIGYATKNERPIRQVMADAMAEFLANHQNTEGGPG